MKDNKTKNIALLAAMFAVIFASMLLDSAITFIPGVSMAVCVLLVTFTFCVLYNSWDKGVLAGAFFGISSFLKEFIIPSKNIVFHAANKNPLVSVLPRVIMALVAFCVYKLMLNMTKNMKDSKRRQIICIDLSVLFGLLTNTVLYLLAVTVFKDAYGYTDGGFFIMVYGALFKNIIPEYLISLLAVPTIVLGVRKGLKLGIDGNNWKKAD